MDSSPEPQLYRTLFYVRSNYDGAWVDSRLTWEDVGGLTLKQLVDAATVTARLTGEPPADHPAVIAATRAQYMQMRMRMNSDIEGGWVLISNHEPDDEELIAWWKENRKTVRPHL